jgi:tRNA(adenine34) deaminase
MDDVKYLKRALELAKEAEEKGSVPIGALIVDSNGETLAEGYNEIKFTNDPTAHAEVVCMRKANKKVIKSSSPEPTTLYTTLEPCFGCSYFITRTNVGRVVWALNDPYKGGIEFLKGSEKMAKDIESLLLMSEPIEELKQESKRMMREYYLRKGDKETAKHFE